MKTIFFNDYEVKQLAKHPGNGDIILSFVDQADDTTYVWPFGEEDASAFYDALGELLNKPKIHMPTSAEDFKRATQRS